MHLKQRFEVILSSFNVLIFAVIFIFIWVAFGLISNSEFIFLLQQSNSWHQTEEVISLLLMFLIPSETIVAQVAFFIGIILFSFNVTLLFAYATRIKSSGVLGHAGASLLGSAILAFGLQCLSCAAVVTFLTVPVFVIAFLSKLPFAGQEIIVLGLLLLCISTVGLFIKVTDPLVC